MMKIIDRDRDKILKQQCQRSKLDTKVCVSELHIYQRKTSGP